MTPFVAPHDYPQWEEVANLLARSFAYMEAITGTASKASQLSGPDVAAVAQTQEVIIVEQEGTPIACLFTRASRDITHALYLGWLAVDAPLRGQGVTRYLFDFAEAQARRTGKSSLTLDTGVQLTQLHMIFGKLGFEQHSATDEVVTFVKHLH